MPMGIKTAPAWFQRFMEATFADFIEAKSLEVYLDDTIVHTLNIQQHKTILEQVFKRIKEKNIKVSFEKSDLVVEEVTFLGNVVSKGQLKPKPDSKDMNVTTDSSELGYEDQLEQNFKIEESDLDDIRPIEYFSKNNQ